MVNGVMGYRCYGLRYNDIGSVYRCFGALDFRAGVSARKIGLNQFILFLTSVAPQNDGQRHKSNQPQPVA